MKEKKDKKQKNFIIKKIICTTILCVLIIALFILVEISYKNKQKQKDFEDSIISFSENNKETIFTIDKIVFFSSCDSKNKASSPTNFTIENLYTYTDIALFIDNNSEENTLENTLKKVRISNIKFLEHPKLGQPNLYYKSINNFAKSEIDEKNKIEKEIDFTITSEDNVDLNRPILYNNCANPITLSYINQNIKTDYTMTDTENPITYNGTLLKRCAVQIESIKTNISFDIEIENNINQKFKTTVYLEIPYENELKSIYDGNITVKDESKIDFYRYE